MELTKNSNKLMSFFHKFNCLPETKPSKSTDLIFARLFHDIYNGDEFVSYTKKQLGKSFYKFQIQKINSIDQIVKPETFNADAFPKNVQQHIDTFSLSSLTYTFDL